MKFCSALVIVTFILTVLGCGGDNMGGCDDVPEFFPQDIGEVYIEQRNAGEAISEIRSPMFNIGFIPEDRDVSSIIDNGRSTPYFTFSLFPTANALSCVPPKYRETVTFINITSDSDFNESYSAGQSLNDVFTTYFYSGTIEESLYGLPLYTSGLSISLLALPTLETVYNFQFELILDSGKTFNLDLENVVFDL